MNVLVIGSGGMLGHMLTLYLSENGYEVTDVSRSRKCRKETILLDVLDTNATQNFLEKNSFDVVVNCAALLTKASEENKTQAIRLNSAFPHFIEEFYKDSTTRVIQVSTAGVYAGQDAPYGEWDIQDTNTFYGKTKSLGEITGDNNLVVRSDFVGPDLYESGIGLFNWIMKCDGQVNGYRDVLFNGVTSLEFSKFIHKAISEKISGYVNLHSKINMSKADFLRLVCSEFDKKNINIKDTESTKYDTSLLTERKDLNYDNKSMNEQLEELHTWMDMHRNAYSHYYGGKK